MSDDFRLNLIVGCPETVLTQLPKDNTKHYSTIYAYHYHYMTSWRCENPLLMYTMVLLVSNSLLRLPRWDHDCFHSPFISWSYQQKSEPVRWLCAESVEICTKIWHQSLPKVWKKREYGAAWLAWCCTGPEYLGHRSRRSLSKSSSTSTGMKIAKLQSSFANPEIQKVHSLGQTSTCCMNPILKSSWNLGHLPSFH